MEKGRPPPVKQHGQMPASPRSTKPRPPKRRWARWLHGAACTAAVAVCLIGVLSHLLPSRLRRPWSGAAYSFPPHEYKPDVLREEAPPYVRGPPPFEGPAGVNMFDPGGSLRTTVHPGFANVTAPVTEEGARITVCCRRDITAPCPAGWSVAPHKGFDLVQSRNGGCTHLRHRHNPGIVNTVRCVAPKSYKGPCHGRAAEVPCDTNERKKWAHSCGVEFPCIHREPLSHWHRCAPQCRYREEHAAVGRCGTGYLGVVLQLPDDHRPFWIQRRLEFAQAMRCNINNPAVRTINLLQEAPGTIADSTLPKSITELFNRFLLGPYYNERAVEEEKRDWWDFDPCGKTHIYRIGRRIRYWDAVNFVNQQPAGQLLLLTNADVSVGEGFSDEEQVRRMLRATPSVIGRTVTTGTKVIALQRYEDTTCTRISNDFKGVCDCRSSDGSCMDSYLVQAPLPNELLLAKRTHTAYPPGQVVDIDFRFGGLWASENVFMEVLQWHGITVENRCGLLRLEHHHCSFQRPTQDARRLDLERWPLHPRAVGSFTSSLPWPVSGLGPVWVDWSLGCSPASASPRECPAKQWRYAPPKQEGSRLICQHCWR